MACEHEINEVKKGNHRYVARHKKQIQLFELVGQNYKEKVETEIEELLETNPCKGR